MITPFASLHLRSCTDKLPEYFVPQPSRDYLLPALPAPEPVKGQVQETPASTPFNYYDEAVFLVCGLVSLFIAEENIDPPKDEDLIWDEAQYFTNQKRWAPKLETQRCYVPQIHDLELTEVCLTETERTPCDVVPFGYRNGKGELLSTPKPQPPPEPLKNAEQYEVLSIPSVRFKSAAKTKKGVAKFREKSTKAWDTRKSQFQVWNFILHKYGFPNTLPAPPHVLQDRDFCLRCGSSFFKRKGVKLFCHDCGLKQFEAYYPGEFGLSWGENNDLSNVTTVEGVPLRESTQGGESQKKWIARVRRDLYIEDGEVRTPEQEDRLKNHPSFKQLAAEHEHLFHGASIAEMAEHFGWNPATARKRKSRRKQKPGRFSTLDWRKAYGSYFCTIHMNGRDELYVLAPSNASWEQALAAFLTQRARVEAVHARRARLRAKRRGLANSTVEKRAQAARQRIRRAWDWVVIGRFAPYPAEYQGAIVKDRTLLLVPELTPSSRFSL